MSARAVALWCALVVAVSARAAAYTVDCNHEYTDCDTELSKITGEEEDVRSQPLPPRALPTEAPQPRTTSPAMTTSTTTTETSTERKPEEETTPSEIGDTVMTNQESTKPRARLLNLNVDELQNFAIALHNDTTAKSQKKHLSDLSDVNLDVDDDDEPRMIPVEHKPKDIPEKFYANLQAPFHALMNVDRTGSEEIECKENEIVYKLGERMDRGCEETCECSNGGVFDCSPRCKHPYIRRGRRLNDPLCFESPVDDCCSIIACATNNADPKISKVDMCRYGNESHPVGSKWHIGCEQTCSCEPKSIVTCKPRCNPLQTSDKCINVQDPNDACCEVQVCDVSHDVHEEPENSTTSTTTTSSTTTTEMIKGFEDYDEQDEHILTRPLVLAEPIGSVKVLQNNSVQVNLMQLNQSEDPIHLLLSSDGGKSFTDVELKYSNLILNLEGGRDYILKTKETGTKFNFTITNSDSGIGFNEVPNEDIHNVSKVGCYHEGHFYAIGAEFHIGCTELCECTGPDEHECAALVCPSHVGLELVSKGCVRWAPSPPATPPNCCPRSARCLSDGTCHYKGVPVPNWSEVPIVLTGCEQRCFCENGELDCQEVCSPLPAVPPQTLRCPPGHRPAAVNISDEDCCKHWGCVPNTAANGSSFQHYSMPVLGEIMNYVTPLAPDVPTPAPVIPTPPRITDSMDFYRPLNPVMSIPKYLNTVFPVPITAAPQYATTAPVNPTFAQADNITAFTLDDIDTPFKTIYPEPPLVGSHDNWHVPPRKPEPPKIIHTFRKIQTAYNRPTHNMHAEHINLVNADIKLHDYLHNLPTLTQRTPSRSMESQKIPVKSIYEKVRKVPISKLDNINYFLPSLERKPISESSFAKSRNEPKSNALKALPDFPKQEKHFFEPINKHNKSEKYVDYDVPKVILPQSSSRLQSPFRKHVTILNTKDMKNSKPTEMYREVLWQDNLKAHHVLTKEPNAYETVLLRPVPNAKPNVPSTYTQNSKTTHMSALDLEHLLNQMEVESVVNKNLGRSADKDPGDVAGQSTSDAPSQQSFVPTIPPEIHFPQDENIPDYDQNNIHRPPHNADQPALQGLPPGLTLPPAYADMNKKLSVISLQADSPTSVKMLFGLPPVLVGLRGSVDLRYTDKADEDVSHWYSQVFAPADEVLTTPRLEFRLTGLTPATTYKIRGKLYLHNLPVEPESEIYTVRTLDSKTATPTVEEKVKEIDSRLTVIDVNDTTAHVTWRRFGEDELQFIDAIQVRYRPVGTPIYSMTELLHHSRAAAELRELRPAVRYEAALVLVPPPRARAELADPARVEFTTAPYVDPYNWTVTIEARAVGAGAAEVRWRGVPAPAERWVRVYRGAHACAARLEKDAFRLATRDLPPAITLTGLQPNTKCRVWLEMFLTNGKVKTSNVLEINTKSEDSPEPIDNEIEASSVAAGHRGDYYSALVGVGAVAALCALTSLLLLLVVLRRHRPRSVPITSTAPSAPRESSLPPYDNPAYKLELQQETMDL